MGKGGVIYKVEGYSLITLWIIPQKFENSLQKV